LVNNEVVIEKGEEMRALKDPIPPEFVREFHSSTIHHPVPAEFLSTALTGDPQSSGPRLARLL
jgi:hypothetical protein